MFAVGMLSLCAAGPAMAEMGPHGPELEGLDHGHLMMLMRIAKLTDDQKAQAHQIMKDAHEQSKPLVKQIRGLKEQLSEKMVGTTSLQLSDLAPLRQQIRDLQIQVDDQALGAMIKVHNLLKPDQLQRVADAHAKFKSLHQQMEELAGPPPEDGPEGEH
jgi:Spy/CpxP family protein refolding chaperone